MKNTNFLARLFLAIFLTASWTFHAQAAVTPLKLVLPVEVPQGDTFSINPFDSPGKRAYVPGGEEPFTFSSSDPGIATVDATTIPSGPGFGNPTKVILFQPKKPGTVTITVRDKKGRTASATVRVTPKGTASTATTTPPALTAQQKQANLMRMQMEQEQKKKAIEQMARQINRQMQDMMRH